MKFDTFGDANFPGVSWDIVQMKRLLVLFVDEAERVNTLKSWLI